MKYLISLFCLISAIDITPLNAQDITFKDPVQLFIHPEERARFQYPFIPFDYDGDELTDFYGSSFGSDFIFKATSLLDYEEINRDAGGFFTVPLESRDMNGDALKDLITQHSILINDGNGDFNRIAPSSDFSEFILCVDDLNGDGWEDIITLLRKPFSPQDVILYLNDGNLNFLPDTLVKGVDIGDVDTGDIDGDGDIDIAYREVLGDDFGAILFNDDSLFREQRIEHILNAKYKMDLVDKDLDGDLDIMTYGSFSDVFILNNVNNFTNNPSYNQFERPNVEAGRAVDLNKDGIIDNIFHINEGDAFYLEVYQGTGPMSYDLVFSSEEVIFDQNFDYPIPNYANNNFIPYDLNKDGLLDIIYTDGFNDPPQVIWFENSTMVTSTDELDSDQKMCIHPNPTEDFISVKNHAESLIFDYRISSFEGRTIEKGNTNSLIDVAHLEPGIYYLISEKLQLAERFIKI